MTTDEAITRIAELAGRDDPPVPWALIEALLYQVTRDDRPSPMSIIGKAFATEPVHHN